MILEKGNMWDIFGKTDMFLITTNPVVTKLGKAVMGRGIAKEAADRYPELPFVFANIIRQYAKDDISCGPIGEFDGQHIGYFMVKDHWAAPALPEVIKKSVYELECWLSWALKCTPDARFDLNFPGIGNGKLAREEVLPLIEQLPDCVHVWEFK